ncbi:TRAP transporter small permease [Chromatiaceae bacterium AAb-1]|nr:TRAP transporter small permease [Chromatiaceae bacterium AAb-1]
MNNVIRWIDRILKWFLAGLMLAIVLVVCWQVVSRFILNEPSSITEELSRSLLIWIGMVGAAFAYRTGVHLGFDILVRRLTGARLKRANLVLTAAVVIFALSVMVFGGGKLVLLTWQLNQMSAVLGVKMAYIYIALPLSGLLITFYGICQLYCFANDKELEPVEGIL